MYEGLEREVRVGTSCKWRSRGESECQRGLECVREREMRESRGCGGL